MKISIVAIVLSVTTFSCFAAEQPQKPLTYGVPGKEFTDRTKNVTSANSVVICKGQPIPSGWVIVAQTTNFACSSDLNNAFVIKQPGMSEVICAYSPIPAGYVITATTTNFACSSDINNARVIQRL